MLNKVNLRKTLPQSKYAYTMEMTIMLNETSCFESDPVKARKSCNIFLLDEVFMLYFYAPNMARFHFFARKNYYET